MEIVVGYGYETPEATFTWEDLKEATVIKAWTYRKLWAVCDWKVAPDVWYVDQETKRTIHQAYDELHEYYIGQSDTHKDNHQTFLVQLKSGEQLFVMFHDWTIMIGLTARTEYGTSRFTPKDFDPKWVDVIKFMMGLEWKKNLTSDNTWTGRYEAEYGDVYTTTHMVLVATVLVDSIKVRIHTPNLEEWANGLFFYDAREVWLDHDRNLIPLTKKIVYDANLH